LGIGQGELSVTTLQLAQYAAYLANSGKIKAPHVVKGYIEGLQNNFHPFNYDNKEIKISKHNFDIVREGMFKVVNGNGTARHIRLPNIDISGKTGTSQNPHGKDHALFIGFAPFENPKIAVAVIVENVGFGGTHAAPIAQKVIKTYLENLEDDDFKVADL
ncbi:MAG: penicillin-binding protein 2, partial [Ignavibacteriae bacterium]|nr:penicillin-binding protein 2 [Ignavibacteriota bacterium]